MFLGGKEMIFTTRLEDFKKLVNVLAETRDDVNFVFKPDELVITAADHANVMLFNATIPKTAFREYDVDAEFNAVIDVAMLDRVIKKLRGNFITLVEIAERREEAIRGIKQDNVTALRAVFECVDTCFSVNVYNDIKLARIPHIEYKSSFVIGMKDLLNDVDTVCSFCDNFIISGTQLIGSNVIIDLSKKSMDVVMENDVPRSMFSGEILHGKEMKALGRLVKVCKVEIGNDFPIRISGTGEHAERYTLMCAPRIEG